MDLTKREVRSTDRVFEQLKKQDRAYPESKKAFFEKMLDGIPLVDLANLLFKR